MVNEPSCKENETTTAEAIQPRNTSTFIDSYIELICTAIPCEQLCATVLSATLFVSAFFEIIRTTQVEAEAPENWRFGERPMANIRYEEDIRSLIH